MFKAWPKISRLENEVFHITEKIDGTNACIIIQVLHIEMPSPLTSFEFNHVNYGIWAQSRTRLITPEDDNYGFAKWVQKNAEQLIKDLGVGYHFGEWWGKGIQRGYGLEEKRFSLFNQTKHSEVCRHVPYIKGESAKFLIDSIEDCKQRLIHHGSFAVEGYMRPEGLVVYTEKAKGYWKVIIDK